jgi:hypothetical protein
MQETKGKCYAPVFKGTNNVIACIFLRIIYALVIALLVLFIWVPGVACRIKQYIFRMRHCLEGNENPEIEL